MNKLAQQTVSYIETTGKALGVATAAVKEAHVAKQAALEVVPRVVDKLAACGLIADAARKQATSELSNHADALEITLNVIDALQDQLKTANSKLAALSTGTPSGKPESSKKATVQQDDADMALLALTGMADKYR